MRRSVVLKCSLALLPTLFVTSRVPAEARQTVRTRLASTTLPTVSPGQWQHDFGYQKSQIYPIALDTLGCPFVDVMVSSAKLSLLLDTGTARGFVITTHAPSFPHRVEERMEELNADGSHRGESYRIRLESISVLGRVFENVAGGLSDWRMFSSEPFDGTIGLDFFLDRRLTLDYRSKCVGVTTASLPERLDRRRYLTADLVEPPKSQGHILYVRANVNGREAIVYFDTGYNVSFIDPAFADGLPRVERPGKFAVFRNGVPLVIGNRNFVLDELRETPISRGAGFELPVAMALGSDVLSRFVITIDIRARRLVLALAG